MLKANKSINWRHLAKDVKMFISRRPASYEYNDDDVMI